MEPSLESESSNQAPDLYPMFARLPPRQRQVACMIVEDYTSQEIADALGVGVKTVDTHRQKLMRALGIVGNVALVRLALGASVRRDRPTARSGTGHKKSRAAT